MELGDLQRPHHTVMRWRLLSSGEVLLAVQHFNSDHIGSESPAQLCERLKLPFGDDLRLLTRALTHRSYVNEHPDTVSDNELLCATFEALVGAIYQGKGLEVARNFILPFLEPTAESILLQMQTIDPKSRLQELTQSKGWGIPKYVTAQAEGPDHARVFDIEVHVNGNCLGKGSGSSKHVAQLSAAQQALENLAMQDPE